MTYIPVLIALLTYYSQPEPGNRVYHCLVYDEAHKQTILLDGYHTENNPKYGEVWALDKTWHVVPGTGPLIRFAAAAVYNSKQKKLVLFGGLHAIGREEGTLMGDTWEWNGTGWKQVATTGPQPRGWHAMAYDEARDKVVLYGGNTNWGKPAFDDTWEWDGTKWTKINSKGPGGRSDFAMSYDSNQKKVILFGGQSVKDMGDNQTEFGDTWTWDGKVWTKISDKGPSARILTRMAFDPTSGVTYLYGGCSNPKVAKVSTPVYTHDDMWRFDGKIWERVMISGAYPSQRILHAMTYDGERKKIVLFGGGNGEIIFGDTWEWDGQQWKKLF